MKKIGIIGSTGMIGKTVTDAFIETGFEVTVLVRNIENAKHLFGNTVYYVQGDLRNLSVVKQFVAGLEYLYLNLSVAQDSTEDDFQPEREGIDNIITASKESSIKRIGYLSSLVHLYEGQNGVSLVGFWFKKQGS